VDQRPIGAAPGAVDDLHGGDLTTAPAARDG
jgi:hypothetical protein